MTQEKEMSFLDHLEELRWHIIRDFLASLVGAQGEQGLQCVQGLDWLP